MPNRCTFATDRTVKLKLVGYRKRSILLRWLLGDKCCCHLEWKQARNSNDRTGHSVCAPLPAASALIYAPFLVALVLRMHSPPCGLRVEQSAAVAPLGSPGPPRQGRSRAVDGFELLKSAPPSVDVGTLGGLQRCPAGANGGVPAGLLSLGTTQNSDPLLVLGQAGPASDMVRKGNSLVKDGLIGHALSTGGVLPVGYDRVEVYMYEWGQDSLPDDDGVAADSPNRRMDHITEEEEDDDEEDEEEGGKRTVAMPSPPPSPPAPSGKRIPETRATSSHGKGKRSKGHHSKKDPLQKAAMGVRRSPVRSTGGAGTTTNKIPLPPPF